MDISVGIHNILVKLLKASSGLQQIMLTDSTGLTIANVSRKSSSLELEGIGALTTALYLGMNYQGGELSLGALDFIFSEFTGGKMIMQSIPHNFVLIGILSSRASIQKTKNTIRRYVDPITDQINLFRTSQVLKDKIEKDLLDEALSELE